MVIYTGSRVDRVRLTNYYNKIRHENVIQHKVCTTPGSAIAYARKVRESGRKAWTCESICYYV